MTIHGAVEIRYEDNIELVLLIELNDGRAVEVILGKQKDSSFHTDAEVTNLESSMKFNKEVK